MKHIIQYKLFESSDENLNDIVDDLNDILLEIKDKGFNVNLRYLKINKQSNAFTIVIYKSRVPLAVSPDKSIIFTIKDILETILTAKSYMTSLGYRISLVESNEVQNFFHNYIKDRTDTNRYDSSILEPDRKEQENDTILFKIEFTNWS